MAANDTVSPSAFAPPDVIDECARMGRIGELFANALRLPATTSIEERTNHFIGEVEERLSRFIDPPPDFHPAFEWEFSSNTVMMSAFVPANSPAQDLLVNIVVLLHSTKEYDEVDMWKGMESFGMATREAWNRCPINEPGTSAWDFTGTQWLNLSSFLARLFQKRVAYWLNFPLWELRDDLEEPLSPALLTIKMPIVREWLRHAALEIRQESLLRALTDEPEGGRHGYPYRPGPLFEGEKGFTVERWNFWKHRLEEIRDNVDENLRVVVNEAIEYMDSAEKQIV
ncbi:hypothetical protein F4806DRAFT_492427 [Annulohypoxylon nitens]|nr:hypothetical protein F4806DRAFT_492427 [Annulohypoxylon nitens]